MQDTPKNLDQKRADEKMLVSEMIALYCRRQHKTPKGSLCPAQGGGPQTHGAAAPPGVPSAGLDGPALAFAVSAAPAGDLRRAFSRGISFCIKGLTPQGSCGILSVVRRY